MMRGAMKTIVALALAVCVSCGACPRADYHARYEPVVAKTRSLGLKPGERRQYRLDDPGNASTLRLDTGKPPPPRGHGAGTIWVEKDEQGHLLIAIETIDHGHAG